METLSADDSGWQVVGKEPSQGIGSSTATTHHLPYHEERHQLVGAPQNIAIVNLAKSAMMLMPPSKTAQRAMADIRERAVATFDKVFYTRSTRQLSLRCIPLCNTVKASLMLFPGDTIYPFSADEFLQTQTTGTVVLWDYCAEDEFRGRFVEKSRWTRDALALTYRVVEVTKNADVVCIVEQYLSAQGLGHSYRISYFHPRYRNPVCTQVPSTPFICGLGNRLLRLAFRDEQLVVVWRTTANLDYFFPDELPSTLEIGPGRESPGSDKSYSVGWLDRNKKWVLLAYRNTIRVLGEQEGVCPLIVRDMRDGQLAPNDQVAFWTMDTMFLWQLGKEPICIASLKLEAASLGASVATFEIRKVCSSAQTGVALVQYHKADDPRAFSCLHTFPWGQRQISPSSSFSSGGSTSTNSHLQGSRPLSRVNSFRGGSLGGRSGSFSSLPQLPPPRIVAADSDQLTVTHNETIQVRQGSTVAAQVPGHLLKAWMGVAWVQEGRKVSLLRLHPFERLTSFELESDAAHLVAQPDGVLTVVQGSKITKWAWDGNQVTHSEQQHFLISKPILVVPCSDFLYVVERDSRPEGGYHAHKLGSNGSSSSYAEENTFSTPFLNGVGSHLLYVERVDSRYRLASRKLDEKKPSLDNSVDLGEAKAYLEPKWLDQDGSWQLLSYDQSLFVVNAASTTRHYVLGADQSARLLGDDRLALFKDDSLTIYKLGGDKLVKESDYHFSANLLDVVVQDKELVSLLKETATTYREERVALKLSGSPDQEAHGVLRLPSSSRILKLAIPTLLLLYCYYRYLKARKIKAKPLPPAEAPDLPKPLPPAPPAPPKPPQPSGPPKRVPVKVRKR